MARIRHIALVVKDLEKTATFYQKALGLSRSEISEGPTARRIYMSDGEVNLALLQYKSEVGSGLKDPQPSSASITLGSRSMISRKGRRRSKRPAVNSFSISARRVTRGSSESSRTPTASFSTSTTPAGR
jgi:hypothetical protein